MRSHLALGRRPRSNAGRRRQAPANISKPRSTAPRNLGEAKHLLANQSDIHYWLGCAFAALGDANRPKQHWLAAATFKGDFQEMSVRAFSEMTYYSALAWEQLGQRTKAEAAVPRLAGLRPATSENPGKD